MAIGFANIDPGTGSLESISVPVQLDDGRACRGDYEIFGSGCFGSGYDYYDPYLNRGLYNDYDSINIGYYDDYLGYNSGIFYGLTGDHTPIDNVTGIEISRGSVESSNRVSQGIGIVASVLQLVDLAREVFS